MTPPGPDLHGDHWARGARADHAVNVAAGGPPDWLRRLLRQELDGAIRAYPDEAEATAAVAHRHGRSADEVVLLNGAAHGFALIAETLAPRRPVVVHPQFTEPDRALAAAGCAAAPVILGEPWALDPDAIPVDADLVVVGNPTNPTGVLHPRAAIEAIIAPGRTVVVDEAFMDFVGGEANSLAPATDHDDLVVVRSLTKILAVPGLRVGYLLAPSPLAARLRDRRQAWAVNGLALAACAAACHHPARLAPAALRARADRDALAASLAGVPSLRVHPGAAGFVLVEAAGRDGRALAETLRRGHGIAVRPAATFPGLGAGHLRLTARGGDADARLVSALHALLR
ncbi:MAG TPA: Rv2231c family pyridoxal phosphate-dependent protein CobC [Baekduia sp.]|uniref:Rv2231c family pyridoxal phosphate-dependent protein CobC n=1 Tax=Baekduia sp. TaxID=2600305 RepID=UPI002CBAA09F|nr:Rv2231c family pyridoxal phosphate-dependent protein CobC [Baekduia sp.]HMJ33418.1 Rv2231c family pyridoxal phosphate-dependent protein CobC [Baekduia sp.]